MQRVKRRCVVIIIKCSLQRPDVRDYEKLAEVDEKSYVSSRYLYSKGGTPVNMNQPGYVPGWPNNMLRMYGIDLMYHVHVALYLRTYSSRLGLPPILAWLLGQNFGDAGRPDGHALADQ